MPGTIGSRLGRDALVTFSSHGNLMPALGGKETAEPEALGSA
jgi:hypothetical protein